MLYGNENDETLVMLTLAGEQRAYEVLVVRHQKRVMSSAASVARNAFVAEDAAQEAFVTAWMKLDTLAEPQKFGAWTAKIAKNCARNAVMRYHEFIPLDTIEILESFADCDENPAELYVRSEEKRELLGSVERLPARVGEIIRLHYFEGLSVAEIADRLRISAGTVKWQLSDGRKRIRKDMCAVNEKPDDTLTVRVMKKVEELKLWDLRECKDGFDEVYADTLGGVESLPDTKDKFHALADVLVRGVWWLSGKGGDEVLARVKEAAILGKNEEVMQFIVSREDGNASGYTGKIDFIKNHQIPELEKLGFRATLAHEWFWLGYWYFRDGKPEEGSAAYERVRETAELSDLYYAMIPAALMTEERLAGEFKDKKENKYSVGCNAYLLKRFGTALADVKTASCRNGFLQSYDRYTRDLFDAASRCDSKLFDSALAVGGSITGSDGTRLTYVSDSETVTVPAGTFEGCCLWEARAVDNDAVSVYKVYYKDGVGIVRAAHSINGVTDERLLKNYNIVGGEGLLPLAAGNVWEYVSGYAPEVMRADSRCEVMYTDGYVGAVEYEFVRDGDGQLIVITDQTGIRVLPPAITDYSSMRDEITEDKLWDEKKYDESRMRNDVNSFRLLAHFIGRDHRTWKKAERGVAWHKYTISIIESFRDDGKLPEAWLGRYWWAHFITACTLFGTRKHKEEGYRYLERAFELYAEWARIPAGEALPVGREEIYGGIKLIKGKDMIELPDGAREPLDAWLFNRTMGNAYYGMTAKRGWEWFNSVRDDELFGEYIERARRFMEAEKD